MIEMASVFGTRRMKAAAALHGQVFETNIPTIGEKGYGWEKLVIWSSCVEDLTESEKQAIGLLSRLMELDPYKRLSAKEALQHEFFTDPVDHDVEWGAFQKAKTTPVTFPETTSSWPMVEMRWLYFKVKGTLP